MFVRNQLHLLVVLLVLYAAAAVIYILMPGGMSAVASAAEMDTLDLDLWQLALANAALILLGYGAAGLVGLWLARKANLPAIYRPDAGLRGWLLRPLGIGIAAGLVLVVIDWVARQIGDLPTSLHPPFPASLLASFAAGVGEEILFRLLMMSLWAVLLGWLLKKLFPRRGVRPWALWLANGIAALAFAAGHLGTGMVLAGVATPGELPPLMLAELIVLNGFLGLLAGESFSRDGLLAAAGVHFWADVVWHVIFGALTG